MYISFSIGSKSLALLRHYVLLLRRCFYNVCRALSRVGRLLVNYVKYNININMYATLASKIYARIYSRAIFSAV